MTSIGPPSASLPYLARKSSTAICTALTPFLPEMSAYTPDWSLITPSTILPSVSLAGPLAWPAAAGVAAGEAAGVAARVGAGAVVGAAAVVAASAAVAAGALVAAGAVVAAGAAVGAGALVAAGAAAGRAPGLHATSSSAGPKIAKRTIACFIAPQLLQWFGTALPRRGPSVRHPDG